MKTISFGLSSLKTSRMAYGCWRIAGTFDPAAVTEERANHGAAAVVAAYEAGFTTFDLADIYCYGMAEEIFGQVLKQIPEMRDKITLVTKCGIRKKGDATPDAPYRYDFSAEHIINSCEQSLKRLGAETIDLYLLHRPDYLANYEEIAKAFEKLEDDGKVLNFGVSNFRTDQLALLQKHFPMKILAHQIEISLAKLDAFHDSSLEQCMAEKIVPMAWSPLGGGMISGNGPIDMKAPDHAKRAKVRDTLTELARTKNSTRSAVALAWLLRHPAGIMPIVGTTNPVHIAEAAKADDLELTREEWYRLMEAANGQRLP